MKRLVVCGLLTGAGALALTTGYVGANAAPESLLPPGFDDPAPTPTPAPRPTSAPRPSAPAPSTTSGGGGTPVVQPIPSGPAPGAGRDAAPTLPRNLPSLRELEALEPEELDELLGLKPKYDMPPAARRSMERVGLIDESEGGVPVASLGQQPASIVRAALSGIKRPMVSRWGHIMLRKALVSRLETPDGMGPVEFAALRTAALNAMGEWHLSRGLAQDIDTGNWSKALADSAVDAYVATGDIVGVCPLARFRGDLRDDAEWNMLEAICKSFAGESARARSDLIRMRQRDEAPAIDVLLAQRYAGAAGRGRSAVNLEWDGVERLSPWRFGLATSLGTEIPDALMNDLGPYYQRVMARTPGLPIDQRLRGGDLSAREGILSSRALIDLYSIHYAQSGTGGEFGPIAARLREAYVATSPEVRLTAIKQVWGQGDDVDYGRVVLTAYASARLPARKDFADDAGPLIASMLAAGLDNDALEWGSIVQQGTEGWAMLALAQASRGSPVSNDAVDAFVDADDSAGQRKSAFLVAGLAGLDRLEDGAASQFSEDLSLGLGRSTRWSDLITQAGQYRNRALAAYLAGVGMQGSSWDQMTPRHLYHIVRALNRSGLSNEARMIAAEAVARG